MKQIIVILSLIFVGCNPHLQQPQIDLPENYLYATDTDSINLSHNWWEMFGDTTLNRLITTALAANNDLKAAVSRIEEARAKQRVVRAQYLPEFALGRSAGVSGSDDEVTQQYIVEPTASWEIPIFGSLRSATTAAKADVDYALWQYRGVELSLAAQVATTYYTLLQYRRDLDIARQSSELRAQTAKLVDSLFVRGMASGVNREQAYNLLYTALADIPLYERAVAQTLLQLDILLGQTPQLQPSVGSNAPFVADYTPINIPSGVPSELLYRRPDMMSSHAKMRSAAAAAKSARIARLPSFSLTGDGGIVSDEISKIVTSPTWAWNALLSLSQPLFAFGSLKSSEKVAIEQYNQAVAEYQQTFISALADVEKALVGISTYRAEIERYNALIESNRAIAEMSRALYLNGLNAYLDVIDAERTLYNSQMEYSNIIAAQYINYINLCQALGGNFY